jgi:hypothetical protein
MEELFKPEAANTLEGDPDNDIALLDWPVRFPESPAF